jgi:excisionase family DNA binding protein
MPERLLTARELAEYLDVSPETILRWTRRGELPAIKLPGGAIRYRAEVVDQWLEECEIGAGNGPRGVSPPRSVTRRPLLSPVVTVPDSPEEDPHAC